MLQSTLAPFLLPLPCTQRISSVSILPVGFYFGGDPKFIFRKNSDGSIRRLGATRSNDEIIAEDRDASRLSMSGELVN